MFSFINKLFISRYPVSGKDAHWLGYCPNCNNLTSKASRYGYCNGGVEHCYDCGRERETIGIREDDIKRGILSSKLHWQKFPKIPYNWHELSENERWAILGMKK